MSAKKNVSGVPEKNKGKTFAEVHAEHNQSGTPVERQCQCKHCAAHREALEKESGAGAGDGNRE
jgi:hypothetical protein